MNLGADSHREPWVNKTFCIWTFLFILKRVGPPAGSEDKHSSEKLKYHPCVHLPPGADLTGTSSVPLINSASSGDGAGQPGWLCALSLQGRDGQSPVCRAGTLGRARLHSHCTAQLILHRLAEPEQSRSEAPPAQSRHTSHSPPHG